MSILSFFCTLVLSSNVLSSPVVSRRAPCNVPGYVTEYAPIVYLSSNDAYRPSDIGAQLNHTTPQVNASGVSGAPNPLTLANLNKLNGLGGDEVYLTSINNVEDPPSWVFGVEPNEDGETEGAISCAIIINDHGSGLVDAFYMYFYAYDFGGVYLDFLNVGNHVGDWEHNMIRFQDGVPQAVWYSQHADGQAFTYNTTSKYDGGVRPIAYSANGTHANYATDGDHAHAIPNLNLDNGIVEDHTDQGPVWDPTLGAYYYSYNANSSTFSTYDNSTPVDWLYFTGHWGDDQYPESDDRQECFLSIDGLCKYTNGPTGPLDKQLNRTKVCPEKDGFLCIVRTELAP